MLKQKMAVALMATALGLSTYQPPTQAQVAPAVITGVALNEAFNRVQSIIDDATQKGNFLLVRAGIEARIALENFKMANTELLDKAFSELDQASRENFDRIDRTLRDAESGALNAAAATQQITESAQQLASVIDIQSYRSYVLRYSPSVVYDGRPTPLVMKVRGVSLDDAEAQLVLPTGSALQPSSTVQQELLFQVPVSSIKFEPDTSRLNTVSLKYRSIKPGWWNKLWGIKEDRKNDLLIMALPQQMATYSYSTIVASVSRENNPQHYAMAQFKGRNQDQDRAIAAPPGWKIDLNTLAWEQYGDGGGNSYCVGFLGEGRSDYGVIFRAHVGKIQNSSYPLGADGYVNCKVSYTLYREVPGDVAGPSGTGAIGWMSDVSIPLPLNLHSVKIDIKTFDGVTRTYSGDGGGGESYVSLYKEPTRLVIRPQVPSGLVQ